jgi:prevent-host-death family protein
MGDVVKTPPRSDDLIFVRTVTATEASRSFAALLDEVEQGQTVIVTRGGRRIATIGPATNGNGAGVLALLKSSHLDEGFADDVRAARESVDSEAPAWPGD